MSRKADPLYTTAGEKKLVDYWPVVYHARRVKKRTGNTPESTLSRASELEASSTERLYKRKRVENADATRPKPKRPRQQGDVHNPARNDSSFTRLPVELVLYIVHFCSLDEILPLGQASHRFRRICADPYLRRIGIVKVSNSSTQVQFGGQPISPSAGSFLRDLRITAPKISLICDLFHASAFSSDIVQFLTNHLIQALEMWLVDDEGDFLADPSFAITFRSILAAVTPTCKRLLFAACPGQSFRPSLVARN